MDIGAAFSMGLIGGGLWHGVKGIRSASKGMRWRNFRLMVRTKAPPMGGAFAMWGGLFTTFHCLFISRGYQEGPWPAIISGTMTGAVLAARNGPQAICE